MVTGLGKLMEEQQRGPTWVVRQLKDRFDMDIPVSTLFRWSTGERTAPAHVVKPLAEIFGVPEKAIRQ